MAYLAYESGNQKKKKKGMLDYQQFGLPTCLLFLYISMHV